METILGRSTQRVFLLVAALLAALFVTGCAGLHGPEPIVVHAGRGTLTPVERAFLTRQAAQGMYEIEVSKLATERAVDPRVRSYAQDLVAEHERTNAELVALMSAKGVAPPRGLTARNAGKLHRLAALPPSAAFDRGYVQVVGVEDHTANITLFERIRRDARDPDLRAWIDRTLPTLRRGLSVAHNLVETIAA